MAVKVILRDYIKQLKKQEKLKPMGKRKVIPSVEDMANKAGVTRSAFYYFLGNSTSSLSREMINAALTLLRECGFDTTFDDILEFTLED